MSHLGVLLCLLALVAGTASLSQTGLVWQRYRKPVILWYGLFLLSLYLIVLYFLLDRYVRVTTLADQVGPRSVLWILQAAGGLLFVAAAPVFYHHLLGLALPRYRRGVHLGIDAVVLGALVVDVVRPGLPLSLAILIALGSRTASSFTSSSAVTPPRTRPSRCHSPGRTAGLGAN